uniref:Uncharacterized protein n=1 Tax=Opuntia streptacantha TaxID=393608 RepID=A0A7C9ALP2_OPUST
MSQAALSEPTSKIKMNLKCAWWSFALFLLILEGHNEVVAAKIEVKKSHLERAVQHDEGFEHAGMMEAKNENIHRVIHHHHHHHHHHHLILTWIIQCLYSSPLTISR